MMSKIIMYDQVKSNYEVPDYKVPGYKIPEGLNIPDYKLPEGLNIPDYKPTLSLDKIHQTLYVQSLMAIFMNMMSQYQYTVPMIQKISKEMPSSSDAGYQPSMEDIQNILQFIPVLEIPN